MSLKAFHVIFVSICTLFALSFGVWAVRDYNATGQQMSLLLAVGSLTATPVMFVYGRWFVRKLRNVSYI